MQQRTSVGKVARASLPTRGLGQLRVVGAGPESPSQVLGLVLKELQRSALTDRSTQKLAEIMARFVAYVEKGHRIAAASDVAEEHAEGFVFAPSLGPSGRRRPAVATMHVRRAALRLYFRTARQLGLVQDDPTVDLVLPPRSYLPARPLTDDEVALCRSFALKDLTATRQPAAWALAEATARTSEISYIRASNLDFDGRRVWIPGSPKTAPRWGRLSRWGLGQLDRRLEQLKDRGTDPALVYEGDGSDKSAQTSAWSAVAETLERAGLAGEPGVKAASVAGWAGAKVFAATGRIDEVALCLGVKSLDKAAELIGWTWGETDGEGTQGSSP